MFDEKVIVYQHNFSIKFKFYEDQNDVVDLNDITEGRTDVWTLPKNIFESSNNCIAVYASIFPLHLWMLYLSKE